MQTKSLLDFDIGLYTWTTEHFIELCKKADARNLLAFMKLPNSIRYLSENININEGLKNACHAGNLEVVKFLLFSGEIKKLGFPLAQLDYVDNMALKLACSNNQLEVVKYMLESPDIAQNGLVRPDITVDHNICLKQAVKKGHEQLVNYIIMDCKVVFDEDLQKFCERYPLIGQKFILRDLNEQLEKNLETSLSPPSMRKI